MLSVVLRTWRRLMALDNAQLTPELRWNFGHLYLDIAGFGILAGSAMAFISVFAARQGATGIQIGLLSGGPAIVSLLMSLPTGRWLEGQVLTRTVFVTSIWNRAGYAVLVILPWLLPPSAQVWAIPVVIMLMSVPGTLISIAFNAMFADVGPPAWRALVVGRRSAVLAICMTIASLTSGLLLDRLPFPLNYQLVFFIGVMGAALSSYHLWFLRPMSAAPARVGRPILDAAQPGSLRLVDTLRTSLGLRFLTRAHGKPLLRLDLLRGPFGSMLAAYLFFYLFQAMPVPLFPLFWVRNLHLTDGQISLAAALVNAATVISSLYLVRISSRRGHHWVLVVGAAFYGIYPLLTGLAWDVTLVWAASLLGGGVWGLASGGLVNRLMERVPEDDRPAHMALHNLVLNLAILVGSLAGPLLGDWLGLRTALLLSAGLRVLAALLLARWG